MLKDPYISFSQRDILKWSLMSAKRISKWSNKFQKHQNEQENKWRKNLKTQKMHKLLNLIVIHY